MLFFNQVLTCCRRTLLSLHIGILLFSAMVAAAFVIATLGIAAFVVATLCTIAFVVCTVVAAVMATFVCVMVATTLAITMTGTSAATALAFLHTAAGGQFGAGSRVGLHIVGIVTQLAHLLTQLVGIGSLRIIVDGQLRRLHVVRIRLHTFEIRHVLFEFVSAFLTNAIGLDRHGLLSFGGRFALLRTHAQRNQAY